MLENIQTNKIKNTKLDGIKRQSKISLVLFIIAFGILCIYSLSLMYVYFWGLITSVKDRFDYTLTPFALPTKLYFENFTAALQNINVKIKTTNGNREVMFFELLGNSLYITIVAAFLSVFVPTIVSYVTARYNFKFNKVLHGIVVFTMVVPISGSLASSLHIMQLTGIYDNMFFGTIIMRASFISGPFLFMYAAFKGVPKDYSESAFIDGAGHFRVLFQIMLPLVSNMFIMFFMLELISWWNKWDYTLIFLPSHPNIALSVYKVQFSSDNILTGKPVQMAICIISALPSILIFIMFKKQIMAQVTFGGLKG